MKKILSIAVLTGLSFFALSCAKETAKSGEGETQVSVSVSLPGIVTKSFADGETAKNLNYVVYLNEPGSSSKDGSIIISGTTSINLTANVEFPLSIGKNYDFVFWADSGEESPYTFDASAKKVTVNYAANNSCSDKGDAFYGHVNKTIVAGDKITCDLIRPFAQVNVGTNDLNAAAVVNSYDKLKATIKVNTYSEFDLMEGKPTGDQAEQSFVASVPASGETFPVTDYKYLAMAYVLVDPEGETQTVTYCVYDEIGGSDEEKIAEPVLNVPLKKNYRTNIYGQLLTSTVAATVTISPTPIGEDINREIANVASAQNVINAGATEVNIDVIEGNTEFIIPKVFEGTEIVTINMPGSGYTITFVEGTGEGSLPAALNIVTPDSQANNLVINCPSLTVTVNGALQNETSTTAANTLIVPEDCVIENLEVLKGNVKIYGTVNNITLAQNCKISHLSVRTAKQLRSIAPICEKISYVELLADIDLGNEVWTPIGPNADASQKFQGTFEGNNHTISNLKIEQGDSYHAAGFFGALNGIARNFTIDRANIKSISGGNVTDNGNSVVAGSIYPSGTIDNVHVKNAKIEANRYIGGIAGYTYGNVTNCTVENLEIITTPNQVNGAYDNGDKVGGISGYFSDDDGRNILSGNTATKVKITAVRDAGGIVGAANADYLSNNTADNITLIRDNSLLSTETRVRMDGVLGYILGGELATSNTATNVTFTAKALPGQLGSIMAGTTTPNTTILLQEGVYTFDRGTSKQVQQTFSGWGDDYVSDEHESVDAIEYTNIKDNFEIKIIGAGKDKSAILWSDGSYNIQGGGGISLLVNKAKITFQDMLLVRRYHSILDAKVETYNNCEIWGNHSSRSETVNYNNCYFNTLAKTSTISGINNFPSGCNQAILFGGYSHYINFDNCEFHTNQNKAVQIYSSMRNNLLQDITAKNCTLYGGADKKDGLRGFFEVHGECGIHGTLTLTTCKIKSEDEGNWPGGVWSLTPFSGTDNYYKIIVDGDTKKESSWNSKRKENVWTGNYTIQ